MNHEQFLLIKLAEECNEVAQQALKSAQFGLGKFYVPIGKSNAVRLVEELNDMIAILSMMEEHGYFSFDCSEELIYHKKKKVREFLQYSVDLGKVNLMQ